MTVDTIWPKHYFSKVVRFPKYSLMNMYMYVKSCTDVWRHDTGTSKSNYEFVNGNSMKVSVNGSNQMEGVIKISLSVFVVLHVVLRV